MAMMPLQTSAYTAYTIMCIVFFGLMWYNEVQDRADTRLPLQFFVHGDSDVLFAVSGSVTQSNVKPLHWFL
jgi:hypothetical protein